MSVDHYRHGLGHSYGIRELNRTFPRKTGSHDIFGDMPCHITGASVNFSRIFSGKSAAAVRRHGAVSIDYYFSSGKAGVAGRSAYHEFTRRIDINFRFFIDKPAEHGDNYFIIYLAVIDFLPSPVDIPPVAGTDDNEQPVTRKADDGEKFSALAFKLMTDPFVGQLTFVRVYSGVLKKGDTVLNTVKGKKERIGRIVQMHANNREEMKSSRVISPLAWG